MEDSQGKGLKVATFFLARRIRDNSVFVKRSGMYFWMFFCDICPEWQSGLLPGCPEVFSFFWAE